MSTNILDEYVVKLVNEICIIKFLSTCDHILGEKKFWFYKPTKNFSEREEQWGWFIIENDKIVYDQVFRKPDVVCELTDPNVKDVFINWLNNNNSTLWDKI